MKLGIVIVTHDRLQYTCDTIDQLLDTIEVPHTIVMVDNASTDGTRDWIVKCSLLGIIDDYILNDENRYPGAATNQGWAKLLEDPEITHFMRCDNDMSFQHGWDINALDLFTGFGPVLGQLGLDSHALDESNGEMIVRHNGRELDQWPGNVGGTCIVPKDIARNYRYSEIPWHHNGRPTPQEDCLFSLEVKRHGHLVGHTLSKLVRTVAWDGSAELPDDPLFEAHKDYYRTTMAERGYRGVHGWLYQQ